MAIGNYYPVNLTISDNDLFLGTNGNSNNTVNYTAQSVADYLNTNAKVSIGGQMSFRFDTVPGIAKTISFNGGGGDNTPFSSITELIVSSTDASGADVTVFLNYLVNSEILLSQQNQPNYFGNYKITAYTPVAAPFFYSLQLQYIGGNGNIIEDKYYDLSLFNTDNVIPIPTLNQVLTAGNVSLLNAKIGVLYGYDTNNLDYGTLEFYDSGVVIKGAVTNQLLFYNDGLGAVRFSNGTYTPMLNFNGVGNNVYTFQNANGTVAFLSDIPSISPNALTRVNDTNVTLTLGGNPNTALLQGVSLTLGWTGTLADSRIASAATWNAKQNAITLTTVGSSGPATFVSNTLNIPDYSSIVSGYVPTSRTLTINGTAYDLTADRTWNVGTVTSVSATGPITSSGGTTPTISTSMSTNKLIGRSTAGTGVMEEITVGTGLTLSAGTLSATSTGGSIPHATASGTDTYTATVTGVSSYADGDAYLIRFTNGNTTGATLNINGLGAIPLYRNNDGAVIGGDIWAGSEMLCVYNSTLSVFQCIGTSSNSLFAYITNADTVPITKGQPVYAFGGTGDRLTVKRAFNTSDAGSARTIGVVLSSSIGVNQKGIIIIEGLLDGLNILPTATWSDGDTVYLGTTAGSITNVKQYAPNHLVYLGTVTTASNGSSGRWYVKVQNGYELDELHNVQAQTPSLKDTLWYDNTVSPAQWKTASISTILGYTPVTNARTISTTSPLQGGGDLTADRTLSILQSSATQNGYLSSTDWSTFNGKQNAITLTTTGSSGSSTLVGSTLNIPTYTLAGLGGISLTSLSSTAIGLTYNNTTGVFSLTSGYLIPTTASYNNTNWDTAYNNRITSLTTTGTGAATLISNVLNIPTPPAATFTSLTTTGSSGSSTLTSGVLNVPTYTLSGLGGQPLATNLTSLSGLTFVSTSFVKMTSAGTFALDTNTYYLASNPSGFTSNTGTVTSVAALTLGTSGTDLSSTVANGTTTPVITLNVPTASATNRGALSSADWSTFNSKFTLPSLTNGSVLFSNGTTIAQDNANLFWDDANNRLGIGTTTPSQLLHVAGNARITGAVYDSSNSAGASGQVLSSTGTGTAWITGGGGISGSGTTNYLPKFTGSTAVGNSVIYEVSGSIGIGTTSPTAKLHVAGGEILDDGAGRITLALAAAQNEIYSTTTGFAAYSNLRISADNTIFTNNATERMRITTAGNVGIGTASPNASAILDLTSTTQGLLIPRMTTTQRNAIASPSTGLIVYDTTLLSLYQYNGTAWAAVGGGGGGSTPVKLTSQTLTAASWTLSGGYYTYSFSNVNVTTTCDVSVTPQNASYLTAYNAQILPFVGVAAGVATFYAQFPPAANMVVDIVITQTT